MHLVFMNEDGVSSAAQWRKAQAFSGSMYVGRPDRVANWAFAYALPDLRVQARASPFVSYYNAGGEEDSGSFECSVQVPGIFTLFARFAGVGFAYRFLQSNPEHGQSMAWEGARVFYGDVTEAW